MEHLNLATVGDGITDDTQAIQSALNTGLVFHLPKPPVKYLITDPLIVPNGGGFIAGSNDTIIAFNGVGFAVKGSHCPLGSSINLGGFTVDMISGDGAFHFNSCRRVWLRDFAIKGNLIGCDGVVFDDDIDEIGTAWNVVDNYYILQCENGINLKTTNYTNPWNNRNKIGYGLMQGCDVGLDIHNGSTNYVYGASPQNCGIGINLGAGSSYNRIETFPENCGTNVNIEALAKRNRISGAIDPLAVVDNGFKTSLDLW